MPTRAYSRSRSPNLVVLAFTVLGAIQSRCMASSGTKSYSVGMLQVINEIRRAERETMACAGRGNALNDPGLVALLLRLRRSGQGCLHYQDRTKIAGSGAGDMPNATATMANPIKTMEAQAATAVSDESGRSCLAVGGYETVGENRVMLSPNRSFEHDYVDGQGSKVRTKPRCQSEHFSCCPLPKFVRRQFSAGRLSSPARTRQAPQPPRRLIGVSADLPWSVPARADNSISLQGFDVRMPRLMSVEQQQALYFRSTS